MKLPVFTAPARRHIRQLLRAIQPSVVKLDNAFAKSLKKQRHADPVVHAILAITPAAAAQVRTLSQFLEQVEYNGRRLAKLNVSPDQASEALDRFDGLLRPVIEERSQPAREQLRLATLFTLNRAFYQVRESEAEAFFGLYRAEVEAKDLQDLHLRFIRVLTRALRASTGRLWLQVSNRSPQLAAPLYIERGTPQEKLIVDPSMRGRFASYWSYPLGGSGLIQLGFAPSFPWLPRELTLLDAAVSRCLEATERTRLRDEVRRLEVEARHAEQEERRRIGRELHDEAGQSMLLLRLRLEMLERKAPPEVSNELAELREIATNTVVELRRIIGALSPAVLERLGLKQALCQLATRFRKTHDAHIQMRIGAIPDGIPRQIQEVIYRVAQESLQNVAKHSHATRVNLFLQFADKRVRLGVRDNGVGFPKPANESTRPTFGLAGMRERASLLGGTLVVRSGPGKGVAVTLDVPRTFDRSGMG